MYWDRRIKIIHGWSNSTPTHVASTRQHNMVSNVDLISADIVENAATSINMVVVSSEAGSDGGSRMVSGAGWFRETLCKPLSVWCKAGMDSSPGLVRTLADTFVCHKYVQDKLSR